MEQKPMRRNPERLNDEGCRLLIEAVVRRAAEDYLHAARRRRNRKGAARLRETTAFFLSDYFIRLTGAKGGLILEKLKEEAVKK